MHRKFSDAKNHGATHFGCEKDFLRTLFFDALRVTLSTTIQSIVFLRNHVPKKHMRRNKN